jgi:hypothetical protein
LSTPRTNPLSFMEFGKGARWLWWWGRGRWREANQASTGCRCACSRSACTRELASRCGLWFLSPFSLLWDC